jgi:hypothetical protein
MKMDTRWDLELFDMEEELLELSEMLRQARILYSRANDLERAMREETKCLPRAKAARTWK